MRADVDGPVTVMLGSAPAAALLLPAASWKTLAAGLAGPENADVIGLTELARPGAPCLLALLGPEWKGRLMGLAVPSLVAAIPLRSDLDPDREVSLFLDRLNAAHGLGLIPRRADSGGAKLTVVDDTRSGLLDRIDPKYRPAFAARDGWLLAGTSAESLGRLVRGEAPGAGETPDWLSRIGSRRHGGALWTDSRASCAVVENALAVAMLAVLAENPDAGTARTGLSRALDAMPRLRGLGEVCAWAGPGTGGNEFDFEWMPRRDYGLDLDSNATPR
jgi:hypothetical protein